MFIYLVIGSRVSNCKLGTNNISEEIPAEEIKAIPAGLIPNYFHFERWRKIYSIAEFAIVAAHGHSYITHGDVVSIKHRWHIVNNVPRCFLLQSSY
jgi:hypothetical protein